ncbi:MAG: DEAD/DEAH box helicase, partial [Muribaculaceae bacterium]|nr:DEAD/DEAH box helicase [Muribaculaceae bacterium]
MPTFAEVILPLPIENVFTYAVPPQLEGSVGIGYRVIVPFGRKKFLTGIIQAFSASAPEGFEVKEIAMAIDKDPIIRHPQLKFWHWIADYYMAAIGDVFKAAVPSGLKVESETFVELNPDYEFEPDTDLSDAEALITQLLARDGHLTVEKISSKLKLPKIASVINTMLEKGILIISEKIVERYRAIKEICVTPNFTAADFKQAFEAVKGAKKQEQLLMALIDMSGVLRGVPKEVTRKKLLERADVSPAILSAVMKKGIISQYKKEINRFKFDGTPSGSLPPLSAAQLEAMDSITRQWADKQTVLLHGVTSSGKTEIYSHIIEAVLKEGRQILYLVPEIALTTQLTRRPQKIFGNNIVVYHSKFSDNERVDIWKMMLQTSKPLVILGARSSIFLPFSKLGLVIVDEEHDPSYKQSEPAPRYNARDAALVLASMHGAKAILGTATPSIE